MTDALIIGAGAAGLAAGRGLQAKGWRVAVLEARGRLGGRAWTVDDFADFPVELGAEFIHGERAATHALVAAAGLTALPVTRHGAGLWWGAPRATPHGQLDGATRGTIEALAAAHGQLARGWSGEGDCSLKAHLKRQGFDAIALGMAEVLLAQTCCAPLDRLSCADLARELAGDRAGTREARIAEGYGALFAHYAQSLEVVYNAPVTALARDSGGVVASTPGGEYRGQVAVVAVPVAVLRAGHIVFDPPLSAAKEEAIAALETLPATKLLYRFNRALWPAELAYLAHGGLAARWWTPGYGRGGSDGVICCYITARRAAALDALDEAAALEVGLGELEALLGRRDLARHCCGARRGAWGIHLWCLGAYAHVPPGAAAAREILAAPEGDRLFFAGEATAYHSNPQTVHGALESGWRAAGECRAVC